MLKTREVLKLLRVCPSTLERLLQAGRFPQPARIAPRVRLWPRHVVMDYINTAFTKANKEVCAAAVSE